MLKKVDNLTKSRLNRSHMASEFSKLKKVIKICKSAGVKRIRFEGYEIDFTEAETKHATMKPQKWVEPVDKDFKVPISEMPTEDDLLFWSAENNPSEKTDEQPRVAS